VSPPVAMDAKDQAIVAIKNFLPKQPSSP